MTWPRSASYPALRDRTHRISRALGGRVIRRTPAPAVPLARPPQRTEFIAVDAVAGPSLTTVYIRGELDLVTLPYLAEQLDLALAARPPRLVVDLAGTAFMDCGSARLIWRSARYLPDSRRLVIRHAAPGVRRVLELTGLDARCRIED